jgi:hypothetical protein
MKLIETAITETAVYMRYADDADPEKAEQWIDFQVPLEKLELVDRPLGDPELQFLAEVRQPALRYVRETVAAETQRLANLAGRRR